MSVITIGIGCTPAQNLAAEVLKFSINQCSKIELSFILLHSDEQWSKLSLPLSSRQRTPFSLQRFFLAHKVLESSSDIGIYLDSDMLVMRPVEQLITKFIATGACIATVDALAQWCRRKQSSVLIMNREGAKCLWESYLKFEAGLIDYDDLIYLRKISHVGTIDYSWNCLEYLDESTALLHFTDVETQPWLRFGNPNLGIWNAFLWRFSQDINNRALVYDEVKRGHVRPSLLEVLSNGPSLTTRSNYGYLRDLFFVPPHRFKKISSSYLRIILAPFLRVLMWLQFFFSNGQPNIR